MDPLATLLWAGAAGGLLSVVVAAARPSQRRRALVVAALLFLPIGILGILSTGIFFLLAAATCLVGAVSSRPQRPAPGAPPHS